jgi:long-chain fatty acid transport protein
VSYEGDYRYSYLPFVVPAAVSQQGSFGSHITFPTIVALGYGIELPHNVRLESDIEYIQFSSFDVLPLRTSDAILFGNKYIAQKWKDTFTVGIGGDWKFSPGWAARAGYQYYQTPVPDNTFSPTIPDSRQHALTAGIGYKGAKHGIEFGYGAILYEPRAISNNQVAAYNGHYNMHVHLFSFTYGYRF